MNKEEKQFDPRKYLIFEAIVGSKLYGTSNEFSDTDLRGICIPPMNVLLDPFMGFEVKDSGFEEEDRAIYNLGHWMKLCADANPNIIELLFIPNKFRVYSSMIWELILDNKNLFLSKKIKHTFTGYAFSQMKKMELHREWFENPPTHKPTREEFGLTQSPVISEGLLQNALQLKHEFFKEEYLEEIRKEKSYREAKKKWDNYYSWLTQRNPERRAMEEKFGYDGKFASHVFRLMSEGKELLLTGNITFPLPNADWLLSIKEGFYSYEQIMEMARTMEQEFELWYEQSSLPMKPNRNKIKELYLSIVKDFAE